MKRKTYRDNKTSNEPNKSKLDLLTTPVKVFSFSIFIIILVGGGYFIYVTSDKLKHIFKELTEGISSISDTISNTATAFDSFVDKGEEIGGKLGEPASRLANVAARVLGGGADVAEGALDGATKVKELAGELFSDPVNYFNKVIPDARNAYVLSQAGAILKKKRKDEGKKWVAYLKDQNRSVADWESNYDYMQTNNTVQASVKPPQPVVEAKSDWQAWEDADYDYAQDNNDYIPKNNVGNLSLAPNKYKGVDNVTKTTDLYSEPKRSKQ